MLRKIPSLSLLIFISFSAFSQEWINKMNDPSVNFYDVQSSFNTYWKKSERKEKFKSFFSFTKKTEQEENEGYTMYKRWENYVEPRVYPSGDRSLLKNSAEELEKLITDHSHKSAMLAGGNWQLMGASVLPTGGGGAGRLNCVRFHPTDPNIIFVGSPAGGLWKTTDGGATWNTATDQLPTLGVSDFAIDATAPNVMYLGTGDRDASDTYGVGVLKSIDGGITWNITGLNFTVMQGRDVNRLLINPANHNMIFAGTSIGLYRSLDAGITWTKVLAVNNIKDIEFKPGTPSLIYAASSTNLYKSTNTGNSFSIVSTGLPFASSVNRIAIAVTPANPNYVYVLCSNASDSGFHGLYRSVNSGTSFTLQTDTPNLLGYDVDGSDTGGNGWYTLSIGVSPTNAEEVMIGGVNVWGSMDGGANFFMLAHWYGAGGLPYVHADIHDLMFHPVTGDVYAACDGGIFRSTDDGNNWSDKSSGLVIGEMYRLGCSVTNSNMVIQGWQDNGCSLYTAGAWDKVLGGDGMECFIDRTNTNYQYAESQNGALQRSSDGGSTFTDITGGISETGMWVTPWVQDPVASPTIYAGFKNVWKSTNRGNTWSQISTFNSSGLTCLAVAPSNPQYIYASNGTYIYRTIDGGVNWTTLNPPMAGSGEVTYIAVNAADPTKIWISRSGYVATTKVFKSLDAGDTWTNLSATLPNLPVNCVVNQTGTNDGIYVGTDIGVYYLDNDLSSWMPYSNGLPDVKVDELEIQYGANKLRAASFGRGLWQTGIYDPSSMMPFPNFAADSLNGCPGLTVQFSDSTTNNPTAWSWTFPGGTPSASTLQNPVVVYNTAGTYNNVTLVVTNAIGTDSITKFSYIAVSPQVQPIITLNNNDSLCAGQSVNLLSSTGNAFKWHPGNQTVTGINVITTGTYSVTVTDVFGCAVTSAPVPIYVFPVPATPVITMVSDTLISSSTTGNQWYFNGTAIAGATDSSYVMTAWGSYYVTTTIDSSGCTATSSAITGINDHNSTGVGFEIYPNPSDGAATLVLQTENATDLNVRITDMIGKIVYEKNYEQFAGHSQTEIDLSGFGKGIYLLTVRNEKGSSGKKIVVE